ncbi:hypothetical protein L873DRAFT_1662022 [Choiromyces venosus 120613-1]|uniref:Myb-like domain-containing protein n=1 Tax=Choiromyces venosus 120613-1 TaxID=1336337 RepID=A0A3N4K8K7_9PEZI|nr:hypothetical protein L873DRAFT_1662022 [Choiromyces venosus 120613-1]
MARDKAGSPWSDAEKLQLLLEIAKQNTNPNWRIIEVPTGRTKSQAQAIFATMKSHSTPPPPPSNKKRAREELGYDQANIPSAGQSSSAAMMPVPITKRKRGRPTKAETEARKAAEARGEILPKPKPYIPKTTSNVIVGPDGQIRRRRGRPTKAETEARKVREKDLKKKQGGGGDDDEDDDKVRQQLGQSEQSELADDDDDDMEDEE